jgi:hypothetical protein
VCICGWVGKRERQEDRQTAADRQRLRQGSSKAGKHQMLLKHFFYTRTRTSNHSESLRAVMPAVRINSAREGLKTLSRNLEKDQDT